MFSYANGECSAQSSSTSSSSSSNNQQQQQQSSSSRRNSSSAGACGSGSSTTSTTRSGSRPGTAPCGGLDGAGVSGGCGGTGNNQQQQQKTFEASSSSRPFSTNDNNANNANNTSAFHKFDFYENPFKFAGKVFDDFSDNIKDSLDGISKNIQEMNKLLNLTVHKTACNSCNANFSIFVRKRKCSKCTLIYCTQCMIYNPVPPRKSICNRCTVFSQRPMSKEALQSLKVRDLKWFLASHNISTHHCYEKTELVDLIISVSNGTFNSQTNNNSSSASYDGQQRRHSADASTPSSRNNPETTPRRHDSAGAGGDNDNNTATNHQRTTSEEESTSETSPIENPITNSSFYETTSYSSPSFVNNENETTNSDSKEESANKTESSTTSNVPKSNPQTTKGPAALLMNITMDDLTDEEQIRTLTVRQLKLLLTRNFVNFKGCVEREELVAKVQLLYRDKKHNDALREQIEADNDAGGTAGAKSEPSPNHKPSAEPPASYSGADENQCKICWEKVIDCVLLDCGHMITCTDCGKVLSECPICRQFIARVVHVFKA